MSSSNAAADETREIAIEIVDELDRSWCDAAPVPLKPAAILRGSARGLEIVVTGSATADAIASSVTTRLSEAPAFFRGSDVRIRVEDGPLATGCLSRLDAIAERFELRIIEVGAQRAGAEPDAAVPQPNIALGTSPAAPLPANEPGQASLPLIDPPAPAVQPVPAAPSAPVVEPPSPDQLELALRALESSGEPEIEVIHEPETRVVVGPVRSGVILEHRGHLIVFGDVNPGAEVRAEGNIVVLGRLRGTAHAGIGREAGFILALRLQPQQLRIGRVVARASDSDLPGSDPEIAHVAGGTIIVERYLGRLPNGLAASI
jgi:septum formation inhibitor MinC